MYGFSKRVVFFRDGRGSWEESREDNGSVRSARTPLPHKANENPVKPSAFFRILEIKACNKPRIVCSRKTAELQGEKPVAF